MSSLLLIACLACACSAAATPLIRTAALRLGLTDNPDGHRKVHAHAIPLGGGLAVLIALLATVVLAAALPRFSKLFGPANLPDLVLFATALTIITVVGLVDDRVGLRGRHKLLGQLAAAGVLVSSGLVIRTIRLFEVNMELGLLAVPFTLFWLVGAINALNLLDGIDGLATSIGAILSVTIGAMALINGHLLDAVIALALAGSLVGFLCFNFPPAKIYLGDAGSMLIGLSLGTLAVRTALKGPTTVAMAAPLAIWAIPIFDSAAAVLRRKLTGRSLYASDRAHLHHCLMARLGSSRRTLIWIAACCAITSAGALVSVFLHSDVMALLSVAAVVGILVTMRIFGHVEMLLLAGKLKSSSLAWLRTDSQAPGRQTTFHMQGSRQWESLWTILSDAADRLRLTSIYLDVNLPVVQEGYHASWVHDATFRPDEIWRTELPLLADDHLVGRLIVTGQHDGMLPSAVVARIGGLLGVFETRYRELIDHAMYPAAVSRPADAEPRHRPRTSHSGEPLAHDSGVAAAASSTR